MTDADKDPVEELKDLVTEEMCKRMEAVAQEQAQSQDKEHKQYLLGLQRGYDIVLFELYQAQNKIKNKE